MTDATLRAEIKTYVDKAFLAKMMQMNEERRKRDGDLYASLSATGHSRNSSACTLGEVEIEEDCIAELLYQKADLYLDAYGRKGLKIGPDVLRDISASQVGITATRKGTLMAQAQRIAARTNVPSRANSYSHLGKKASIAMKEIEAKIDLYNLTPRKLERDPVTVNNTTYHLSGTGNRVMHGDDNSSNVINEQELFDKLSAAISAAMQNVDDRGEILAKLDDLKKQKTKIDYLAMVPKFVAAAAAIGHVVGPYLPALIERAESLL